MKKRMIKSVVSGSILLIVITNLVKLPIRVNADKLEVMWSENYGGSLQDIIKSVIHTSDGGYIAVGYSHGVSDNLTPHDWGNEQSGSYCDGIIIKMNADGSVAWTKNYGGIYSERFHKVIETINGYLIVGESYNVSTNIGNSNDWGTVAAYDGIILEIDHSGTVLWTKNYGGQSFDYFYDVITTANGYLIAGASHDISTNIGGSNDWGNEGDYDGILIEVDPTGNVLWAQNYGGPGMDYFNSVVATANGYLVVGYSYNVSTNLGGTNDWGNLGGRDAILLAVDTNGDVLWSKNLGGTRDDGFNDILETTNGYLIAGYSGGVSINLGGSNDWGTEGGSDGILVEVDANGDILWSQNYGSPIYDSFVSVIETVHGYLVVGSSNGISRNLSNANDWGNQGGSDGILMEVDTHGIVLWSQNYGGSGDELFSNSVAAANGYLVVGYSNGVSTNIGGTNDWGNQGGDDAIFIFTFEPVSVVNVHNPITVLSPATRVENGVIEWLLLFGIATLGINRVMKIKRT